MNTSTNLFRRLFVLLVAIIGAIVTIGIIRVTAPAGQPPVMRKTNSNAVTFPRMVVLWI